MANPTDQLITPLSEDDSPWRSCRHTSQRSACTKCIKEIDHHFGDDFNARFAFHAKGRDNPIIGQRFANPKETNPHGKREYVRRDGETYPTGTPEVYVENYSRPCWHCGWVIGPWPTNLANVRAKEKKVNDITVYMCNYCQYSVLHDC
jgi:hypothetical protein